ncbi:ATP-binding protein [Paralimibaculum aggregatum]|uniref:histidine kinase n=1 Tax=Paralimibaculum aggregatum TaxID=3036245 RepID=A0ABQ6LLX6_9RHOB|nr:ATP-binding protein [Limibaculum sp. NKW23]GMG82687.1 ATP-binding protein [Limibaculum sp. NKW23]
MTRRPRLRSYQSWVANETLEDYSLRYAAKSFRRWSPFVIANTALGGISFLALEAIGGAITLSYGFANAFPAIIVTCLFIFVTAYPIAFYSSRHNIDMDLLTRGAGFGYIGSTITSLIYASFTFIFFALEGAIMAQALKIYADIPLVLGYLISSLVVIPVTFVGMTMISRLQLVTQPVWIVMMLTPFFAIAIGSPESFAEWAAHAGSEPGGDGFDLIAFGSAVTILFALSIQIGEQVDYLRFLPERTAGNRRAWWSTVISAGPGWIVIGGFKILFGSLLAVLAVSAGLERETALEPVRMFIEAYGHVFDDPRIVMAAAAVFVLVSQVKINVTNAYAGSLAWSNFFSRATHQHPGRVVWLIFNILISLLLMLLGIFQTLELVLAVYSVIAAAWIGSLFADLAILKPMRISPPAIEFRRAYLHDFNPVGCGSMAAGALIGVLCFAGLAGDYPEAYAAPLAFLSALVMAVAIGVATRGRYYLARQPVAFRKARGRRMNCAICGVEYERPDMVSCAFYDRPLCSLCCTLDAHCHDVCKAPAPDAAERESRFFRSMRSKIAPHTWRRLRKVLVILLTLSVVTAAVFLLTYRMVTYPGAAPMTQGTLLFDVFLAILPLLAIGAWWIVLSQESRELAERDLVTSLEELGRTQRELAGSERLAAIGQITATVSHELRNPLGTVVTSANILGRRLGESDGATREELDRLQRNVWRCVRIIDDLLEFSRRKELMVTPIDLDGWIRRHLRAGDLGISAEPVLDLAAERVVTADPERLRQVLANLLTNAVHACEAAGRRSPRIAIETRAEGAEAVLRVSDNGAGMDEETREQVFEPLFSTKAFGVGLGLPIVRRIVEQHGGSVAIESRPGEGTTVTVRLPAEPLAAGPLAADGAPA